MKRKLLLAALFVVSALGFNAKAQVDGTYYIQNVGAGRFIEGGNDWGTKATITDRGIEFTLAVGEGTYTIKSGLDNGFLGKGGYVDQPSADWTITPVDEGTYTLAVDGKYLVWSGAGTALDLIEQAPTTENGYFKFVTKDQRIAALSNATKDNPISATFLIGDPNFSRHESSSPWTMIANNQNLAGGNQNNQCAESWHSTFSLTQTITVPAGVYSLTAQGFYRQDGSDNDNLPYFFIGDEKMTFPVRTGSENSMSDASASFSNGLYITSPIYVAVGDEGTVELGAKNDVNTSLWCIWDNFQIKFYGNVSLAEVVLAEYVKAYNEAMDAAKAYLSVDMFDEDKATLNAAIANNTLDLNATTENGLTTATENLNKATAEAELAAAKYATYATANSLINGGTNVDLTSLLKNPSFEADANYALVSSWTNEGVGIQGQDNTGFDGYRVGKMFAERWANNTPIAAFKTYQTVSPLPAGIYEVSAVATFNGTGATLFANENSVTVTDVNRYSVLCQIDEKGEITLGVQGVDPTGSWFKVDDFQLKYIGTEFPAYTLVTGKMESAVATAQTDAETAFTSSKTVANYNALLAAINNAQASVNAYAAAQAEIAKANETLNSTNVYTAEAYTAFKNAIDAAQIKYDESTMTTAEANGLANILNNTNAALVRNYVTGAWTATNSANIYTNNWSVEGDAEGSSGMKTPFIEYWVADANKLADTEISATLPVEDGLYSVTAFVRLFNNKTAEGDTGYEGVSFQVNNGTVVPFADATEYPDGVAKEVTFEGLVKDGNLVIKAIVSGTNISWLAMKNVKYTKVRDLTEEEKAVVPTGITLDKTEVALNTETTTVTLVPTFSPDNATTTVTWTSSDETVATVDANGVVTALTSGTTTITVASTLNPEVKATATVTVTFPETSSSYVNEGPKRTITTVTGNNLIKNGSFEYPNGFYGWTNAADGALGSDKFDLVAEDGNVYLKAKTNEGSGSAGSIGTAWAIEAGKTYEFGYRVKGNPGTTGYQILSMTNVLKEEKDENKLSGTVTVANSWTYVKYEFTNTDGFAYLQFRARWLASNQCFDDFYLVEKGGTTITEEGNVEYATAAIPTANIGDGAFKYSQTAIDAANALVQGDATVEQVQNAYDALQVLNAPAANTRYAFNFNCEGHSANGNAITLIEGGRPDQGNCGLKYLAPQNVNYAQSFVLTKSDAGVNYYNISTTLSTGTTMYLTTATLGYEANNYHSGLRWTDDATKALNVEIRSASEGQYYLWNTMQNAAIAHNGNSNNDAFTNNSATFSIVEAPEAEVTLNSDGGYYTLMLPFAAELPEGMKAYTCDEVVGNVLTLTEATSFVPNTPYIVVEGAGDYTFSGYGLATADSYKEGLLTGAYAETDVPARSYVLAVKPGETDAKFYVVGDAGAKLPAYRAYLTVANSEVKAFTIGRGDATGISAIEALQNGDAEIYTINGTRVNTLQKGVNIIKMSNGKTQKVLVK